MMTNRIYKIGPSREQLSLLPPRVEDYVAEDNSVRAIEAYVCALGLEKLGFQHAGGGRGAAELSSGGSVEGLSLRLPQLGALLASPRAGGATQSGTDVAAEGTDARLSDDRQLPPG